MTGNKSNFPDWYQAVVREADMAEPSPVRGSMIIKPWGYGVWEQIQKDLDRRIKETGHDNCYFPLFIPLSFIAKEAQHVEGFAKEMAVVTHHRLKMIDGKLQPDPEARLEEPLIVRPTSETIINHMFAQWIRSHRDLPMMINQWCNVVRWEMRTRIFLRTTEFLWQEGHTAHATRAEAEAETLTMLEVYRKFAEEILAIPIVAGRKSAAERFPGAEETYTIEGLMGDGRALQCGTSHFLGQNFARAFEIRFLDEKNEMVHPWQTSWGVSTRLLGAIIMTHGDDQGLRLPPAVASIQVVVVPIWRKADEGEKVLVAARSILLALENAGIRAKLDEREGVTPGFKFNDWEMRGVPLRVEIGPRDVASGEVVLARRDTPGPPGKSKSAMNEVAAHAAVLLGEIQKNMLVQARAAMEANTHLVTSYDQLRAQMEGEGGGGFADIYWCGNPACETKIREDTRATCRAIPLNQSHPPDKCVVCREAATERALFAKAY